jgi:pyruvate/2-oxoglutarate dehydrogenase complex dihydrolipoamide acyltransferase (E2) component
MFVVVAGTIVAFWSDRTTWTVVPVSASLAVGDTIETIAGEDGREPAGVGAARLAASEGAALNPPEPPPPQAATARTSRTRPGAARRQGRR